MEPDTEPLFVTSPPEDVPVPDVTVVSPERKAKGSISFTRHVSERCTAVGRYASVPLAKSFLLDCLRTTSYCSATPSTKAHPA